jgi:cellulose biosynthesis protein BcsQ
VKTLAVYNLKGGVGKTATATNLAWLTAAQGLRTLLIDLDPQAAATFYLRVKPRVKGGAKRLLSGGKAIDRAIKGTDFEHLDLLPADFSYRKLDAVLARVKKPKRYLSRLLRPLADEYDLLIIDCAPSIALASESVFRAADVLLVPTIPTPLSLGTLRQILAHLGPDGSFILPFFSMVDRRKGLHRQICEDRDSLPCRFLETEIPYSSVVERMGIHRAPVATFERGSRAARAYEELWREVREAVWR